MFHTVFSLFVNSAATIAGRRKTNKRQFSEMEKAAKAAFVGYNVLQFFAKRLDDYCCSRASPILIFASLRRLLISASKTICALFCVMPCTIAFFCASGMAPAFTSSNASRTTLPCISFATP
ncbi:hypothetical protein STM14_0536 [Salmonella enterica subsp. enterica serovar Typhimurium str. 14028S]|uniref:Uncharacterized protein n=1 Tax=Salmonella typhimurium (strain 14028s / SGSC 2262) TaxID=588858 RepID=A0A0F6AXT2_SALT1|nr:hypothetical protein STM14_0536 [Salmonella enterica subsp. enterica serovar Typhimurium str. 14028S]